RLLRELAGVVGAGAAGVEALVVAAGELDLAFARGVLSRGWRGAAVEISDDVRLLGARHPLLARAEAVPSDLDLGGLRALVVSGPNTGGKTVALKTLGLAALLHQSGLRPPAREAALPVFDQVLADVGDEQSIAMSLSTFSAHLRNIVAILDAATERSLVLLDELAAGTDPVEGSALARALLERLAQQARLTVVTTHHPEVKEWASAFDGAANAATGFDPDTQAPLYRLVVGRPGTSHALQIAAQLGLDPAVVRAARDRISPDRLRVGELVAQAEAAERQAAEHLRAAVGERAAAARELEHARLREAELAREVERVRASAGAERRAAVAAAERELAEARAELSALRAEIRAARRHERRRSSAPAAERELRALEPLTSPVPLAVGDPVEAPDGVHGTIATIEETTAEVLAPGGLRLRIPRFAFSPAPRATPPTSLTFAACARRRRARRCARSSTPRRSRGTRPSASSTAAARARFARLSGKSSPRTASSRASSRTRRTARRSRISPDAGGRSSGVDDPGLRHDDAGGAGPPHLAHAAGGGELRAGSGRATCASTRTSRATSATSRRRSTSAESSSSPSGPSRCSSSRCSSSPSSSGPCSSAPCSSSL